jgi:hypothetical protein
MGGFPTLDFLWFLALGRRQKLSDQVAGTYVVRGAAEPSGRGRISAAYYTGFCYFFVVREVVPLVRQEGADS